MSTNVPYEVLYYQNPPNIVDISSFINSVSMKLQGSGKIRTASMMLNADDGAFISNTKSGATPIISDFDKIEIFFDDLTDLKRGFFLVNSNFKQLTVNGKNLLPLELTGQERALQDIKTQAYYQFKTPRYVVLDLLTNYNKNYGKGSKQPAIILEGRSGPTLDIPNNVVNIYDFSSGVTYFDAIMHVINRLNQPTAFGGVSNFYSMIFEDYDDTTVIMRIFVQGQTDGPIPTIESTEAEPFHSVTVTRNTPEGTQVLVRGMANVSTMPPDLHKYMSYVEIINNYPKYDSSATYIAGIRVNSNGTIYEAVTDVPVSTPPPNASYWVSRSPQQIIGVLDYSPWTKNKELVVKNSCSNPDHSFLTGGFDAPAFPDGNLVIRDRYNPATGEYNFFRDFAWMRAISDTSIKADSRKKKYLMSTVANAFDTFYYGFTVLVDTNLGTPSGAFAGSDRFGRSYANSIAFYDGSEWIVIRTPQVGDQCAVYMEGRIYEWNYPPSASNMRAFGNGHNQAIYAHKYRNSSGTLLWRDISGTAGGNDCFHRPQNIENVDGLIASKINGLDYTSYITDSAVKVTFEYNLAIATNQSLHNLADKMYQGFVKFGESLLNGNITDEYTFTTEEVDRTLETEFYDYGWWFALPFPYPFSEFNNIHSIYDLQVGDLYGGGANTATKFAALDLINSNFSHSGLTGYNHDEVSDMGGPFTGLKFWFLFDILINGTRQPFQGNLPFTVTIYDDLRQVWRADFTLSLLGNPQNVEIPFSNFTVDRPSRVPYQIDSLANIIANVVVPEIEIRSIFEQRRVRLITIQFAAPYDEYGRYALVSIDRLVRTIAGIATVNFVGTIDGLCLTKQGFVSSGQETERIINPPVVDAPNVRNLLQLESIAKAEKDIYGFPFEQFVIETDGKCNYNLEQSIYVKNQNLINEEDKAGTPNTRKLVLMTNEISYDTNRGFIRTMYLTKRIEN